MHGHRLMLACSAASLVLLAANKGAGSSPPADGAPADDPPADLLTAPPADPAPEAAASEPGSPSELDLATARIAELEKENTDLVTASTTAIEELNAKLAEAEQAVALARQREDQAVLDYNRAIAEVERLKAGGAPSSAFTAPPALHDGPFVVMQTSTVQGVARGRVATGDPRALSKLVEAGKARRATVAEVEAAGRTVATLAS